MKLLQCYFKVRWMRKQDEKSERRDSLAGIDVILRFK